MKANRILLLCSAVALPQLALADAPSPQALGMVDAILTYCAKVDPKDADSFRAQWASISHGSESLEHSAQFKQAFDLVDGELEQTSKTASAKTCAAGALPVTKGHDDSSSKNGVKKVDYSAPAKGH
jgi:hypothetical protein